MLPLSVRVIVRDWLNANHIVLIGRWRTVLIDSWDEQALWHGQPFTDVGAALERSLQRLAAFERDDYLDSVPLYADSNWQYLNLDRTVLADPIVGDRERSGAVRRLDGFLVAA